MGRTTSPYYDSHPIVFEDKTCARGSIEELTELQEEGKEQRNQTSKVQALKQIKETATTTPKPVVAGTTDNTTTASKFVGSVNSNLFHDPSCSSSKRIKAANQVWFESIKDAEKSGYSPSKCTKKLLGI